MKVVAITSACWMLLVSCAHHGGNSATDDRNRDNVRSFYRVVPDGCSPAGCNDSFGYAE